MTNESIVEETQLREAILRDPTADAPYLVYGDWLQARGDPRGELVALMYAAVSRPDDLEIVKKADRAMRKHRGRLGIDRGIALTWRLGFVESIRAITRDRTAWIEFLKTGEARFAQRLELSSASGHLLDVESVPLPTSLRHVLLKGTRVANIDALATLTQLCSLIFEQTTKVRDLSPLATLSMLEHLDASGTRAADLKPLASLQALRILELPTHSVEDLSPLHGLPELASLGGRLKRVTDLSTLTTLPKLRRLELWELERVRDRDLASVLSTLTNLDALVLAYRKMLTDLGPLTHLKRLCELNLNGSNVTDLAPLRGLENLTTLSLEYTKVTDLRPLAGCMALEDLSVRFVESVTDVSALRGLKNLKTLDVCYTGVRREQRRALMEALPELAISPNLNAD